MTDYFHGDEDDADQLADDMDLTVIGRDRRGLPCFGCFFTALFEAFTDDQLATIEFDEDVPPEVVEHSRRAGATFSTVTDGMAFIVADLSGPNALDIGQSICERFMLQLQLHATPATGRPN